LSCEYFRLSRRINHIFEHHEGYTKVRKILKEFFLVLLIFNDKKIEITIVKKKS